jgi:uncharacterized membrane protein
MTKDQRLDRIVLGLIAIAMGLATIVVGLRLWTIGDTGWIAHGSISGKSTVTLSYVFVLLVFLESVVLFAFANTWKRPKKGKGRKAT